MRLFKYLNVVFLFKIKVRLSNWNIYYFKIVIIEKFINDRFLLSFYLIYLNINWGLNKYLISKMPARTYQHSILARNSGLARDYHRPNSRYGLGSNIKEAISLEDITIPNGLNGPSRPNGSGLAKLYGEYVKMYYPQSRASSHQPQKPNGQVVPLRPKRDIRPTTRPYAETVQGPPVDEYGPANPRSVTNAGNNGGNEVYLGPGPSSGGVAVVSGAVQHPSFTGWVGSQTGAIKLPIPTTKGGRFRAAAVGFAALVAISTYIATNIITTKQQTQYKGQQASAERKYQEEISKLKGQFGKEQKLAADLEERLGEEHQITQDLTDELYDLHNQWPTVPAAKAVAPAKAAAPSVAIKPGKKAASTSPIFQPTEKIIEYQKAVREGKSKNELRTLYNKMSPKEKMWFALEHPKLEIVQLEVAKNGDGYVLWATPNHNYRGVGLENLVFDVKWVDGSKTYKMQAGWTHEFPLTTKDLELYASKYPITEVVLRDKDGQQVASLVYDGTKAPKLVVPKVPPKAAEAVREAPSVAGVLTPTAPTSVAPAAPVAPVEPTAGRALRLGDIVSPQVR